MYEAKQYVVFTLGDQQYCLNLSDVERVLRAVEITPLPEAPSVILGIINYRGQIKPVASMRQRFHLPSKDVSLDDRLVVAHTSKRKVALLVDSVSGVIESAAREITDSGQILPDMNYIEGVVKTADGMVLIHDLSRFLSLHEEAVLDAAMGRLEANGKSGLQQVIDPA